MEHVVYSPAFREIELISDWSNDLGDFEWAFSSRSDLFVVVGFQVPRV